VELRRTWPMVSHQRMHWKRCIRVDRETGPSTSYEVASEASASVEEETPKPSERERGNGLRVEPPVPFHRLDGTERSFGLATGRQSEGTKAPSPPRLRRFGNGSTHRGPEEPREGRGASQNSLGASSVL
jgi:hypothetical protein